MFVTIREDPHSRIAFLVAAALTVSVILMHILTGLYVAGGGAAVQWVYNVMLVLGSGSLAVMAILLWRAARRSRAKRRIWAMMAVGFAAWAIGDGLYTYNQMIVGGEPLYPAFPDVSFALAYLPLGLALAFRVRSLRARPDTAKLLVVLTVVIVIASGVVAYGVVPALSEAEDSAFAQFITLLYPIGNLALVTGAAMVFLTLEGGRMALPWLLIPLGFLLFVIADTTYATGQLMGIYNAGLGEPVNLITFVTEVTYFAAYALIGVGFYVQGRLQRVF